MRIYEVGEDSGHLFIAMEFVEGKTLRSLIGGHALPVAEALRIATEITRGLERAHRAGIVHRDLKPDNVLVQPNGTVKVIDFGLAKLHAEKRSAHLTEPGMVFGTPAYMSPEQARGGQVDARSDLFSLGVVFYEMLTGANPFLGPTPTETLHSIVKQNPTPVGKRNPEVPEPVAELAERLLAKEPSRRPASAAVFLDDLSRLMTMPSAKVRSEPRRAVKRQKTTPRRPRAVNAWLEDAAPPLRIGVTYQLLFNIGGARADAILSEPLQEPDWGRRKQLDLLFVLSGFDVDIEPTTRSVRLERTGDTEPVGFSIRPQKAGKLFLYLSIFLARELTLLEQFRMVVPVVAAAEPLLAVP